MIKILFFIETLSGGGAEKVLIDLVNHLDQNLFDITVHTLWPSESARKLDDRIRYRHVYSSNSRLNRYRMRLESSLGLIYKRRIKDDYDVECAYLEMGSTKILASSTNTKAKKLAWVHCDLMKAVGDPEDFALRNASRYAKFDRIVCVSNGIKESFDTLFGNRFSTVVLNNVIDDEAILRRAGEDIPEFRQKDALVIMAVGRLSKPKNYYRLLKAHERILNDGIKHQLWIIGEGPERSGLERYATEHAIKDTVHMPGFCENPYAYMSRADVIVCSSSYEGYSTAITEAVILGKPIVTTDCYGMEEILGDSEFGIITENTDEGFYKGLRAMLENAELREMYSNRAAERRRAFSAQKLAQKTEQFISELVEETR